jgi:hypothetical protein
MAITNVIKNGYWEDDDTDWVYSAVAKDINTGRILGRVTISSASNTISDVSIMQGRNLKTEIEDIANDALSKLIKAD